MNGTVRDALLPENQRRTLEELTGDLDMNHGDVHAKRTAFWTMLTLSAVIASAGVLADSTATVIGAMIIAPAVDPDHGDRPVAGEAGRPTVASASPCSGASAVIAVGVALRRGPSRHLRPGRQQPDRWTDLARRPGPGGRGRHGARGRGGAGPSRRRGGAARRRHLHLPGAPRSPSSASARDRAASCSPCGALLLFLSNLLALVLSGTLVFAMLGYGPDGCARQARPTRRAEDHRRQRSSCSSPSRWSATPSPRTPSPCGTARVQSAAGDWVEDTPGATITGVENVSTTFYVHVRSPADASAGRGAHGRTSREWCPTASAVVVVSSQRRGAREPHRRGVSR